MESFGLGRDGIGREAAPDRQRALVALRTAMIRRKWPEETFDMRNTVLAEMAVFLRAAGPARYMATAYGMVTRLALPGTEAVPPRAILLDHDTAFMGKTPQGRTELQHRKAVGEQFEAKADAIFKAIRLRTEGITEGMPPCRTCRSTEHVTQFGEDHSKASMDEAAKYQYRCEKCGAEWSA